MNDLSNELSLIVCRQCAKLETENEIEFSTRLYNVYNSCRDNIDELIVHDKEPDEATRKIIEAML